jgi:MFS family permease
VLGQHLDGLLRGTSALHARPVGPPPTPAATPTAAATPAPAPAAAAAVPEPADHTTFAVFAAAAVALLTAFPADLLARNLVDRAPLDRDNLVTVRDFILEKAIFFGIAGALAALAVGFLSRRSREPIVSFLLGLGAGIVAGAAYAGAYAGLTLSSAEGTDTASTAVGMIAAGAFLGWAFAAERSGSRMEASCAGLAGGLLAGGVVGLLHESLTGTGGHRLLAGLCIAIIVATAGFVGLRIPRESTAPAAELLTRARAAPPAMHR